MPLFEYDCPGCGRPFEKLVRSASQADAVLCPACGNPHVKRKLSTFAVKGSSAGSRAAPVAVSPGGL
ncbi:MAG: zinc ribbon domain-containing protein [Anaerolineae bacterium]|nr:zinc ribbon domain-containing protein [Anaerolineae bacterium]